MLRKTAGLASAGLVLAATAACGGWSDDSDATYAPAAYYQTVGNVYQCYYITSTQETDNLKAAGLCPAGAIPTLMPISLQEEYWSYWSSPAYYNAYIPASYRSRYTSVTIVTLSRSTSFQRGVSSLSSKAVYRSSSGGTVTGSKVNTVKFGSGNRSTTTYNGSGSGSSTYKSGNSSSGFRSSSGRK